MKATNNSTLTASPHDYTLVSDEAVFIYSWVMFAVACQIINVFGIGTNIINIVCFVKQGFKDLINISLLGLAVSDLCSLLTLTWINLSFTPSIIGADLPFDALEIVYPVAGIPHMAFNRVTIWITAIITLERCVCVLAPLKVKQIITRKRMLIVITCVFIMFITCGTPAYSVIKMQLKFFPAKNKTLYGLTSRANREAVDKMCYTINSFLVPLVAFLVIIICTSVLVVTLQQQSKWRERSTAVTDGQNRNQNVAKMVVMISALFIFCFVPISIFLLAMAFEPGLLFGGKFTNIGTISGGIALLLESINSSGNIFIYYHMSVKYRTMCRRIFCRKLHSAVKGT